MHMHHKSRLCIVCTEHTHEISCSWDILLWSLYGHHALLFSHVQTLYLTQFDASIVSWSSKYKQLWRNSYVRSRGSCIHRWLHNSLPTIWQQVIISTKLLDLNIVTMDLWKKSIKKYSLMYPVIIMLLNNKLIHWVCCDMKIPPREYNRDIIDSYPSAPDRLTNTVWYLHVQPDITQPIKRQRHLPLLKPLCGIISMAKGKAAITPVR